MKRDHDYIRELLLECELNQSWVFRQGNPGPNIPESEKKHFHLRLLCDAELMEMGPPNMFRITNRGYDYLEAMRDEGIWNETKKLVSETGGTVTLEILKSIGIGLLKRKIEKHTGIDL